MAVNHHQKIHPDTMVLNGSDQIIQLLAQFFIFLRKNTEGWLIVNVISEGVSDLALKKAEYSYIMEKDGIKSLLRQLTMKIEALKELG